MKIPSLILFSLILCLGISPKDIRGTNSGKIQKKLPILNKKIQYPQKALNLEVEEKYIFLETRKETLLDNGALVYYVSDKKVLITNTLKGDVFIFGMDGKAISHFNQKGGYGYSFLSYALYDESHKEVFIADHISKKIVVFTEEGALKRTLHIPSKLIIKEIYNFDENTLLAFHEHQYGELTQSKPYMFISKKDGSIISELNIVMNKANSKALNTGGVRFTHMNNYSGNCKFGNDFILANLSSDTIYLLKQDKKLIPVFVQQPSVFSDPPIITSVGMKTDDFITFCVYPYDLKEFRRKYENNEKEVVSDLKIRYLMYEFKTDKLFELEKRKYWAEKIDIPKNTSIELLQPYILKDWLKRGYLKGEMKEVAEKVNITDNPILRITKFKL